MMILTVTDEKISSEDGAVWLCLKVTDPAAARRFCMAQDKPGIVYDVEIKAHKDKRSLDANQKRFTEAISKISETTKRCVCRKERLNPSRNAGAAGILGAWWRRGHPNSPVVLQCWPIMEAAILTSSRCRI